MHCRALRLRRIWRNAPRQSVESRGNRFGARAAWRAGDGAHYDTSAVSTEHVPLTVDYFLCQGEHVGDRVRATVKVPNAQRQNKPSKLLCAACAELEEPRVLERRKLPWVTR